MAKPLQILFGIVGALLLIIVAVAIALPWLFDPNDYRDQLARAVKKETGREFAVGEIRLAVFPWLRVALKDVSLGNAEGFGSAPMLTAQRAELAVRLLPLLQQHHIEASAVALEGVTVQLLVNAEGRSNWQDLIKPEDPAAPVDAPPIAQRIQKLDIGGITLDQVQLAYRNEQADQSYQVSDLKLSIGRLNEGRAFPVEARFKASASAPVAAAAVEFASEVTLQANGDVRLATPRLRLDATQTGDAARALVMTLQGESLHYTAAAHTVRTTPITIDIEKLSIARGGRPALIGTGRLVTRLDFDLASGDARFGALQLKLAATQAGAQPLTTAFAVTSESLAYTKTTRQFTAAPLQLQIDSLRLGAADSPVLTVKGHVQTQLSSDLGQQQHEFNALAAELQLGGSALPGGKPQAMKLRTGLVVDLAASQLALSDVQLTGLGLNISGRQWHLSKLDSTLPTLDGDLRVAPFEPRTLWAAWDMAVPPTADARAFKSASFTAQITANAQRAALKNLTLQLDDSTLRGDLTVPDVASHALRFELSADRLDADRYLPPTPQPGASVGAGATAKAKAAANATALPIALIDQLNAQGTLAVASMTLKNLKLATVRLRLDGRRGGTHRQQLSASLYGGRADLDLTMAPGAKHHSIQLALTDINAAPLLKDLINSDKLSGRGSLRLDATSSGRTWGAVKQALDGKLTFNLVDGAVKGFNLGQVLRSGQALLARQVPTTASTQRTDFAELRGSGVITNGVLQSDDLTAKNPLLRLEGAGEIDLVHETIHYLAKPMLVNTASGQGGKDRLDLSGLVVPIRISGALYTPKVSIDWQAALQQQAVGQLREKLGVSEAVVREQRDALRARAKQEISKGLLKLFGGPQPAPATEAEPAEPARAEPVAPAP